MKGRLIRQIDRLLPPGVGEASLEDQRRSRTLLLAFAIWLLSSIIFAPLLVAPEDAQSSLLLRLMILPFFVVSIWFSPLDRGIPIFLGSFTVLVTAHYLAAGEPSIYVLGILPVGALLLDARGGVLLWAIVALLTVGMVGSYEKVALQGVTSASWAQVFAPVAVIASVSAALIAAEGFYRAQRDALADHRLRFKSIADGPLHILEFGATRGDPLDGLMHASPTVGELVGYTRAELAKGIWRTDDFLHPEDRSVIAGLVEAAYQGVESSRFEFRVRHRDGRWVWLEANLFRAYQSSSGGYRRAVGLRDITRERRERGRLIEAQRLESLGTLAGGIAHDFNNLLTVIAGYSEALDNSKASREIMRAVESARELTGRLLAFGRQHPRQLAVFPLDTMMKQRAAMLTSLANHRLAFEAPESQDLWTIEADPGQVEQVLVNLVSNASDAIDADGMIRVSCGNTVLDASRASELGVPSGEYVTLQVSDDGNGMDEATGARAFEPFFTTKPNRRGSGLGLASVYGIVDQSRGAVVLESAEGAGTSVRIFFPRSRKSATPNEEDRSSPMPRGAGERILLVEDDRQVRDLLGQRLADLGYVPHYEGAGESALERFRSSPDSVDLLLTDVVLPAMSGPELASQLRSIRGGLPVLFVSGHDSDALGDAADGAATSFLAKPFSARELALRLRSLLERHMTEPATRSHPV